MNRAPWYARAACRPEHEPLFFPGPGDSHAPAKAICAACPVQEPCLDEALADSPRRDHGIRGGLSQEERVRLRRALVAADIAQVRAHA